MTLCSISRETGRQIGLLINRKGKIEYVIAGSPSEIVIPDLKRVRKGSGRLRGLRLVHTHLNNEPLSRDDLTDLVLLRLDLVAAIGSGARGEPQTMRMAYLNPDQASEEAWSLHEPEPFSRFSFPFLDFIQGLESELSKGAAGEKQAKGTRRAILVHISSLSRDRAQERLDELEQLGGTEMIETIDQALYSGVIHPKTLIGSGRMKDLIIKAMGLNIDLLLFDQELSPAQARWIGGLSDIPILDRTQLILQIFARRAFSKEGKLKVELAKLKYMLPRLGSRDDSLSRIRGGIGVRGPGETEIEVTRRRVKDNIQKIEKNLAKLSQGREQRRSKRKRSGIAQASIIGYTNAGKSTLLNALTNSEVLVEDKLFATLEPTSRRIRFPKSIEAVISDTVGFIRHMPKDLMDAFRSTLEELHDADLLLHLVDISSPHFVEEMKTVEEIIIQLGLERKPRCIVLNKIDLVTEEFTANETTRYNAIPISASKGVGLEKLQSEIVRRFAYKPAGQNNVVLTESDRPD